MVVGFVIGPIFERYLFLSQQIYGTSWMLRPVVIGIALIIAWVLYRPLSQTTRTLWHEFRHLDRAHIRLGAGAWFTLFGMAVATAALITSAQWPLQEQIVPRTACWAAIIAGAFNLVTEIFGADKPAPAPGAHAAHIPSAPELPAKIMLRRAVEFFLWLGGLVALASLIGFVPAIGVFVFVYMGIGFREPLVRAAIFGVAMTIFCYALFDRGLSVPWPQSVLGDIIPALRDSTGLL